jgi:hypothetical protein
MALVDLNEGNRTMECLHPMAVAKDDLIKHVLDGENLPEGVSDHLEQCDICRHNLVDYQQADNLLIAHLYRSQCPDSMQLSLFCGDYLSVEKQRSIAAHLQRCPLCTAEVAATRQFLSEIEPVATSHFSLLDDLSFEDDALKRNAKLNREP